MQKILVATRNKGKLAEFKLIFDNTDYQLIDLDAVSGVPDDVEETGDTFEENAKIKAMAYGDASGLITIGDDSGLMVDALGGRPGVYSARYAPTVDERNEKLLNKLDGVDKEKRSARFVCVVCYFDPTIKKIISARGTVEGEITFEPRGNNGFGYDPLFYSTELGKTFGEATDIEKNKVSHRSRALKKLKDKLARL